MIRDPSDGSVRKPTKSAPAVDAPQNTAERNPSVMPDCAGADTGLPPMKRRAAQLEKSRAWLKEWKAKRGIA